MRRPDLLMLVSPWCPDGVALQASILPPAASIAARAPLSPHALEGHRPGEWRPRAHLGTLGAQRHDTRLQQRREIHQSPATLAALKGRTSARLLFMAKEADLGHASLQGHLAALEATLW